MSLPYVDPEDVADLRVLVAWAERVAAGEREAPPPPRSVLRAREALGRLDGATRLPAIGYEHYPRHRCPLCRVRVLYVVPLLDSLVCQACFYRLSHEGRTAEQEERRRLDRRVARLEGTR